MSNELERKKEAVKVLSWKLPEKTEENLKIPRSAQLVSSSDLNQGLREYKTGMLPTSLRCVLCISVDSYRLN
jgi:hypothetical protein